MLRRRVSRPPAAAGSLTIESLGVRVNLARWTPFRERAFRWDTGAAKTAHPYKAALGMSDPAPNPAPRWSVIIPAYNEEDFLGETVTSIKAQTVTNATLILVDNKSTDGTAAVMEEIAASSPERTVKS